MNMVYIGWQCRNFFIPYLCFPTWCGAIYEKCLLLKHQFLSKWVIIRTFSKNQLVQFYSNNATNLYHLTSHGIRRVVPQHRDRIVTTDYCDVTSSYVYQDFPNGPAKGTRGIGVAGEWTAWGGRFHPLLSMVFLRVTQMRHV